MPRVLLASGLLLLADLLVTDRATFQEPQSEAAMEARLIGRVVTLPTGAIAAWHTGHRYSYQPIRGGRTWPGRYTVSGSIVCVELVEYYGAILGAGWGGMGACFRHASVGSREILIDRLGRSFPLVQLPGSPDGTEAISPP